MSWNNKEEIVLLPSEPCGIILETQFQLGMHSSSLRFIHNNFFENVWLPFNRNCISKSPSGVPGEVIFALSCNTIFYSELHHSFRVLWSILFLTQPSQFHYKPITRLETSNPPIYCHISFNHNALTVHLNALQGILLVSPHLVVLQTCS